jgi:P2-related tail formation protein
MANISASSIRNKPHLAAFDGMTESRMADIDFSPVIMNLIDTCPSNALPYLLSQFDVLGYKGSRFTITELEQRELIKKAIELHKYKGTPWSVKEALKLIGITDCEFVFRNIQYYHNGLVFRNSTRAHSQNGWAEFSVKINVATFSIITTQIINDIVALVTEYKNARSKLISVIGFGITHNGFALRDGTYTRNTAEYFI